MPWRLMSIDLPISGPVDRAPAAEMVDSGSIPGRIKPKTTKIGIHKHPCLLFSN